MNRTAIIIGATGLVGSQLVQLLISDATFQQIKIFGRRSIGFSSDKITEFIVDFDNPASFEKDIIGDVLFSTMGTTIRSAGSKDAQYKVDYTYQYSFAKAAVKNHVKKYVLVSSAGANSKSRFFYMQMKGKLDDAVRELPFNQITIIRPATLAGNRNESRAGEKIAIVVTDFIAKLIPGLKKYRPINAEIVAEAMINSTLSANSEAYNVYSFGEVFKLAGQ